MRMESYTWDYSKYSDILHIHKKDVPTKGSAEMGDFTLDFGKDDDVVGIEIEHASEFFQNLDISKDSLSNIKQAKIHMDARNPQCKLVFLMLQFPNKIVKKIPVPMPLVAR